MELQKLLKELKNVKQARQARENSRRLLLSQLSQLPAQKYDGLQEKEWSFSSLYGFITNRPTLAAEIAFALIFAIGGGLYLRHESSQKLVVEANNVNASIQVKLDEVKYLLNKPSHLTPRNAKEIASFLEEAEKALKEANESLKIENLENSLEKMKVAENAFSEIESIAKAKQ